MRSEPGDSGEIGHDDGKIKITHRSKIQLTFCKVLIIL